MNGPQQPQHYPFKACSRSNSRHSKFRRRSRIAAIRAELERAQAADVPAKGTRRLFEVATGNAMRADFDRQTRAA